MTYGDLKVGDVLHGTDSCSSWLLIERSDKQDTSYATYTWFSLDGFGVTKTTNLTDGHMFDYTMEPSQSGVTHGLPDAG